MSADVANLLPPKSLCTTGTCYGVPLYRQHLRSGEGPRIRSARTSTAAGSTPFPSGRQGFLQARDEHPVDALDHLRDLLRREPARLEPAAPVDRRATAAEVVEPYGRHVVGERERTLQHRVRERVVRRVIRLEPLANRRPAITLDRPHGADAAALDRHPGASRRPRAQIAEVGEARPHTLDRCGDLI